MAAKSEKVYKISPMMEQYERIKGENPDSILFFRVGDFYEMFNEDAKIASEELDLVLTGKDCGLKERAPMCGVPYHSCEAYIARLIEKGHKVAICEQTEDPALAKKLVDRGVIRIITPGTVIDEAMLDEGKNNYLCSVVIKRDTAALCFTDASTGECNVTTVPLDETEQSVIDAVSRYRPSEVLISAKTLKECKKLERFFDDTYTGTVTVRNEESFDTGHTENIILRHFSAVSTENLGILSGSAASAALGAVLEYLYETGVNSNISIKKVNIITDSQYMRLDLTAVRNLELTETMRTKSKKGSLLWVLDKTKTAMGKRLLRSWLQKPLTNIAAINMRFNALDELASDTVLRGEISEALSGVRDIERIMTRVVYGSANPRDLLQLAATAGSFPTVKNLLCNANCRMLKRIFSDIDPLDDIKSLIDAAIDSNAKITVREGGIIKKGYNAELDAVRGDMENGSSFMNEIEQRERERTGIKGLKVKFNKVFGYYIEVTNSFLDMVPEDYIRKQTLTGAERFVTDEIKELEKRMFSASSRVSSLEYDLFCEVRNKVAAGLVRFQNTAAALALLDVLNSLAAVSVENRYCRPVVDDSGVISIKDGRHPVVERMLRTPFVANDTYLDMNADRCAIITGPNMAGKSTYMRQTALIVLMAQIGCFVPATSATVGIVDAVFTRVGASDDLAAGQSTFMVEMSEVADIVKNATKKSLIILDEIGRGTSTFDGMSIARAVLEYVADKKKLGAKSLFATHYHELTEAENELEGIRNYNIAVKKRGEDITFLRRIVRGAADSSYGIEVARLSGIPSSITDRARAVLNEIESEGVVTYKTVENPDMQMPIEMQGALDILKELRSIDANTLTPIEALQILFEITNKANSI